MLRAALRKGVREEEVMEILAEQLGAPADRSHTRHAHSPQPSQKTQEGRNH